MKVQVEVDKVSISMEIDTGACVSIIFENRYHKLWPGRSVSHIYYQVADLLQEAYYSNG